MIIIAILLFGLLIVIHELGHYLAARWAGIRILEFSIGMGPTIYKKEKDGTQYSLRLLPIGGFVKMDGEDGESRGEDGNKADYSDVKGVPFTEVSAFKRAVVLSAGAIFNIISALIIMFFIVGAEGQIVTTTIASAKEENTSFESGLQVGDEIVEIEGKAVNISTDIIYLLLHTNGEPQDLTVMRNGEEILISDVVFPTFEDSGMVFSYADFFCTRGELTPLTLIHESFFRCTSIIREVYTTIIGMITGDVPMSAVSGPVGTTQVIGEVSSQGFSSLISLMVFISINLGVVNLIPFPALDGGRLFFLLVEVVRGKPMKAEHEGFINLVGFALLMVLIVFVTYNDIARLFGGA